MNVVSGLRTVRTTAHPGPGPMPGPLLSALDLQIRRRIEGMMSGEFRATSLGEGTELAQVRTYQPGDDVRQIEWNVTARTRQVHVRVNVAEKALTTWLVLDVSQSMTFGTADRRKADVAEGVALAVGHLATRRANRLGVMTFGGTRDQIVRPSQGRAGLLGLLTALRREHAEAQGETTLVRAISRAAAMYRTRSVAFVVSDFRGPHDWKRAVGRLASRHEVFAVEIVDPREQELSNVGDLWLVDPETGRQVRVDTGNRLLRRRFEVAAWEEREDVRRELRSAGAQHVVLSTSGDWLRHFVRFLSAKRARV